MKLDELEATPAEDLRSHPMLVPLATASMTDPRSSEVCIDNRQLLRTLIDHVPDLLFVKDRQSRFILANEATARDVGQPSPDALIGKTDLDFYEESLARKYRRIEEEIMLTNQPLIGFEEPAFDSRDGNKWYAVTKLPLCDAHGAVVGLVGCCRDITERKRVERLHEGQVALLERIAATADLGEAFDTLLRSVEAECPDIRASILLADEAGERLFLGAAPSLPASWFESADGFAVGEGAGSCGTAAYRRAPVIVMDVETDPLWVNCREALRPHGLRACWSWPIFGADGGLLGTSALYCGEARGPTPVEARLAAFCTHVAGIAIQRKNAEDRVRFLAKNDFLTGLPNRFQFESIIDLALRTAAQRRDEAAVVFIDIDGFKNVNGALGHRAGDRVLRVIAERLLSVLGPWETAARFGGDEFVVLLRDAGIESGVTLARIAALRAIVGAPVAIDDRTFHLTTSMGVAHYPRDGATPEALIANAGAALSRAKEFGQDNVQLFTSEMTLGREGRLFLQEDMRRGLREEEFILHYQPQVSVATGRVVGAEALVRWRHPTLGMLSPATFVPLAEQTGLIVKLGDWVLRTACRQNRAWQQAGLPPVVVSINVSARQFRERDWVGRVAAALAESGLDPHWLELELTESLIVQDPRNSVLTMRELRELGVQISIDDFGTGYSNLSSLKTFPISRLKIDQSFVRSLPNDPGDSAITAAVISLGHQLGFAVVAEGVETAEQMDFLRAKGCDDLQGYLLGHPMPAAELEARLRT